MVILIGKVIHHFFVIYYYLDIISELQKGYKNAVKNSQIAFTVIPPVLKYFSFCFIFFLLFLSPLTPNHLRITCLHDAPFSYLTTVKVSRSNKKKKFSRARN